MHKSYQITEESFYKYLKCPSWLIYEQEEKLSHGELIRLLQKEGLMSDQIDRLIDKKSVIHINKKDTDDGFQATLQAMKQGVRTIFGGVLVSGHHIGRPDLLEKVEGNSNLGNFYYVACDLKRSLRLKDEYKYEACFYGELLESVQDVKPMQGYVMHADGSVSSFVLDEFESEYSHLLDKIENILHTRETRTFLTSACKQSPYFHKCLEEAERARDLSLINRIWKSEVDSLKLAGIQTIDDLADAKIDQLKSVSDMTLDRAYFLQQQAISLVDKKVILTGEVVLPESKKSLVIDIESDPLRGIHYLFGILVIDGEKHFYKTFFAEKPEDEERNWLAFIEFLSKFKDTPIYHYGWYEVDVFRKLTEKYQTSAEAQDLFTNHLIDLLTVLRDKVIFPSPFYSLKDIAKFLGFNWRTGDASGLDSIIWYHEWLESNDNLKKQQIIDYNEDDVRATWFLKEWAEKQYAKK
jgi:predicted RecB family nuclease